ncbi:MAG: HPr family phosphocarrier protein [Pseudomonadota bacterium]
MSAKPPKAKIPVSVTTTIVNRRGLHARASARFCAVAGSFDAAINVTKDDITVGGRSIMGMLMLGAGVGSEVTISATGPQAAEAVDTLVRLIADKFGEGE